MDLVLDLITKKINTMVEAGNSDHIVSKRKAINSLFPYAILLEQGGQQRMIDVILGAARVSDSDISNLGKFMWDRVVLYISRLYEKDSPASLNRAIALISPYVPWEYKLNNSTAVFRWAEAAEAIPYTEEIGRSTIDTLLQIAAVDLLRPHIPIELWTWLKKRPSFPPVFHGLLAGGHADTVASIRRLQDIDLFKSYFLLVWTDKFKPHASAIHEMRSLISEKFGGSGMAGHREDLLKRLDCILEEVDQMPESVFQQKAKRRYTKLKDALLDLHEK